MCSFSSRTFNSYYKIVLSFRSNRMIFGLDIYFLLGSGSPVPLVVQTTILRSPIKISVFLHVCAFSGGCPSQKTEVEKLFKATTAWGELPEDFSRLQIFYFFTSCPVRDALLTDLQDTRTSKKESFSHLVHLKLLFNEVILWHIEEWPLHPSICEKIIDYFLGRYLFCPTCCSDAIKSNKSIETCCCSSQSSIKAIRKKSTDSKDTGHVDGGAQVSAWVKKYYLIVILSEIIWRPLLMFFFFN